MNDFEKRVLENLEKCDVDFAVLKRENNALGVAVSGGADSVSLLLALLEICKEYGVALKVITVDHKIRNKGESANDALFVKSLSEKFKKQCYDISFYLKELGNGEVFNIAEKRKNGIEEAARFLRYNAFYDFAKNENLPFICLAHNENDKIETILMRFLQGSTSLVGIKAKRDIFLRPLLDVDRSEIEKYLKEKGENWQTDKTNFNEKYFRNRVRNSLVPFLDEKFAFWKKSVLNASKRIEIDEDFFEKQALLVRPMKESKICIEFDKNAFQNVHKAILIRVIFNSIAKISSGFRFPFYLIDNILNNFENCKKNSKVDSGGVEVGFDEEKFYIKKKSNDKTTSVFFAIIDKAGHYEFPFGDVDVAVENKQKKSVIVNFENESIKIKQFPFCIRSRQIGDKFPNQKKIKGKILIVQELFSREMKIIWAGSIENL